MTDHYSAALATRIIFGCGGIEQLSDLAAPFGERAYLMIDPFLKGSALEMRIVEQLRSRGIETRLWHDIVPNPRAESCDEAAADLLRFGAELIVAIGGGSTIDAAKAVALVASNGGRAWDYTARANSEILVPSRRGLPLIAVPTNAGTGAEVTPYAVLSNQQAKLKATIIHSFCQPDVALIDPVLHMTKPARLTASTGVDTFLHAFEGYIGNRANGWADLFAEKAMELTLRWLPKACQNPTDITARSHLAEACYMAGIALSNVGVGIPHALGQALGALKDTPHGESCAAFLIATIDWTQPQASDRLAKAARLFNPELVETSDDIAASRLAGLVADFFERIGMDTTLTRSLGAQEIDDLLRVAETNYGFDIACSRKLAAYDDLKMIVRASL